MSNQNDLCTPEKTFETIIEKALPDCQKVFIANYDDVFFGFDICPTPGVLIQFKVGMDESTRININKFYINSFSKELVFQTMFRGAIPEIPNGGIDLNFIETILRNWKNIG